MNLNYLSAINASDITAECSICFFSTNNSYLYKEIPKNINPKNIIKSIIKIKSLKI